MNKSCFILALLVCAGTVTGYGQDTTRKVLPKSPPAKSEQPHVQLGAPQALAYAHEHESGRIYLQRRAQEKAAARRDRIEGMRWLGHSPARPVMSTTPFMGHPPTWVGVPLSYPAVGFTAPRSSAILLQGFQP